MFIKICGLFRDEDIDIVNEVRPDYIGFVFAKSKRRVSPVMAQYLRFRLANGIIPAGVFVNARIAEITELYSNGIISIAQLHGEEDESYIAALKKATGNKPIPVIKTLTINPSIINTANQHESTRTNTKKTSKGSNSLLLNIPGNADYILLDSGAGSGKTFNWDNLNTLKYPGSNTGKFPKPWFLAGGINIKNIDQAMALNPFAIDVSSGAETDGIKDRKKILELVATVRGRTNEQF